MEEPFHVLLVYPPNLNPFLVSTNTRVVWALSHFLWNIKDLSLSSVALYNKLNIILYLFPWILLDIKFNSDSSCKIL